MGKLGRRALVLLVTCLAMSVIAACGDDDDGGSDASSTGGGGKEGGSITMSQTSQPDYLDPALSYTVNGWEPLSTVWSSGSATSVILKLVNSNTQFRGNDFAVDDIFLGTETSVPEPGTAILLLAGLGGLAARSSRQAAA